MDDLSPSQQDALNQFVVVTGTSLEEEETMAKAIALLTHYDYNLNNAVLAFFDRGLELPALMSNPTPLSAFQAYFSESSFSSGVDRYESLSYRNLQGDFSLGDILPKLAKAPRISNKWQLDLGIHMSRTAKNEHGEKSENETVKSEEKPRKLSILWIIFMLVPKTISLLYSAFKHFFGLNLAPGIYDSPSRRFMYDEYDENYDARKDLYTQEIESTYNLACNNFNQCHESSQQDFHFLLIILCDNKSVDFTRKLLNTNEFKQLFAKDSGQFQDTVLFVNNVEKSPEAFEVAATYNFRRTPYISLVGNVTRDQSVMSSMSVIYKANCSLGDDEEQELLMTRIARNLTRTLNDYNPQLVTKRFDKQEIEMSRIIKEKQDEAYLESLQSDKVKKIEKENQRLEQEKQEKLITLRKGAIKHFFASRYYEKLVESVSLVDCIRISIKLPNGKRIVQKFPKAALMGEIYIFVETQLEPAGDFGVEEAEMTPETFLEQFDFNFELFKPLPKCVLPCSKESITDFGSLKSGDNVLFEYIDEEDE